MLQKEKIILCESATRHEELVNVAEQCLPQMLTLEKLSELFKVFGDVTRLRILMVLLHSEACTCGLAAALQMTPSAVSHQLKILKRCGLVTSRREGKIVFYQPADDHVRTLILQGLEHAEEQFFK